MSSDFIEFLLDEFQNNYQPEKDEQYKNCFLDQNNIPLIMTRLHHTDRQSEISDERKNGCTADEWLFIKRLQESGLQVPFLQATTEYLWSLFEVNPSFSDYEIAIRYSCIAACDLKKLSGLTATGRQQFFDNILTGIRYAGDKSRLGRSFHGREEIQKYAPLLSVSLVKEIVCHNFELDVDYISKRITDDNMVFFVNHTRLSEKDKRVYEKIDADYVKKCSRSLSVLTETMEQLFSHYTLTALTGSKKAKGQKLLELLEESTGDRIYVWGKLNVWKGRIVYTIAKCEKWNELFREWVIEYQMGLEDGKEYWKNITSNDKIRNEPMVMEFQSGPKEKEWMVQQFMTYLEPILEFYGDGVPEKNMENDMEIVVFWHGEMYGGKVKDTVISVNSELALSCRKEGRRHLFFVYPQEEHKSSPEYYVSKAYAGAIKSVNILLGKNGKGKTSTMKLLQYDGVEGMKDDVPADYFIVYKRKGIYFYSTNLSDADYEIAGGVIQKGIRNISEYRRQKNRLIYFSNVLLPYPEREAGLVPNMVNLSSQYIRDTEIAENDAGIRIKELYNRDAWRQLQFLYDTYDDPKWHPEYVEKVVSLRENPYVPAEDKLLAMLDEQHIDRCATHFFEYREWKASYRTKEELGEILHICQNAMEDDSMEFFEIGLPKMSSGQNARLTMFSRLHDWIKQLTPIELEQNNVLLLDEIEVCMHPEWQRNLIYDLIRFFEWEQEQGKPVKVQLFISSNSPFLISDVDAADITVLDEEIVIPEKTFAQNIHSILKESFFMKSGSMGEYAKQKIEQMYDYLLARIDGSEANLNHVLSREEIKAWIERIGEPILQNDLQELYEEAFRENDMSKSAAGAEQTKEMTDEELEQLIRDAQEELNRRRK